MFDILIIGGGPAGAASGILLAQRAYQVAIIEKQKRAVDKLCGEFFSPECVRYLDQLGVLESFFSIKPSTLQSIRICSDISNVTVPFQKHAYGLPRKTFDEQLLCNAEQCGVSVFRGNEVKGINSENGVIVVHTRVLESNSAKTFKAKLVIGATGAKSGSERLILNNSNQDNRRKKTDYIAFKRHAVCNNLTDTLELYFFDEGYIGINPVGNGIITICGILKTELFKQIGSTIDAVVEYFAESNHEFERRLASVHELTPYITVSNLTFGKRENIRDDVVPVGDAAGSIHPFCGEGISMALKGAFIAAESVDDFFRSGKRVLNLKNHYAKQWRSEFTSHIRFGAFVNRIISYRKTSTVALNLIKKFPSLVHIVFNNTRDIK